MLFKGYVEIEESFLLRGEEHIDSFIEALKEGKEYVKKGKEKNEDNTKVDSTT